MVFKGRFFSSKKSDPLSPDGSSGSNSNSPIRSDKKKAKSASPITPKKDDKGVSNLSKNVAGGRGGGGDGPSNSALRKKGLVENVDNGSYSGALSSKSSSKAIKLSVGLCDLLGYHVDSH
ncbi:hypothetical protein CQW23_15119 [Capsicum baccatum]|uniref:Uncharacterized protein n=1 Tax=Capsicum baccatum TaxID=33114 RepID=A0A2G2WL59_CAPBA|nr:hypothetical protein CQW23_15119 [Capsicum baccatum]